MRILKNNFFLFLYIILTYPVSSYAYEVEIIAKWRSVERQTFDDGYEADDELMPRDKQKQKQKADLLYRHAKKLELGGCIEASTGFLKAAALGHTLAQDELGHANIQYNLALCYICGLGVERCTQKAIPWLQKASAQEHAESQYILGFCYTRGLGIKKSKRKAEKFLRKAQEKGHQKAQLELYYLHGKLNL